MFSKSKQLSFGLMLGKDESSVYAHYSLVHDRRGNSVATQDREVQNVLHIKACHACIPRLIYRLFSIWLAVVSHPWSKSYVAAVQGSWGQTLLHKSPYSSPSILFTAKRDVPDRSHKNQ